MRPVPPVAEVRAGRPVALFLRGAKVLNSRSKQESSLPPDRAFVIQFRSGGGPEETGLRGRVEHLTSCEMTHFQTQEELLSFIKKILLSVPQAHADMP